MNADASFVRVLMISFCGCVCFRFDVSLATGASLEFRHLRLDSVLSPSRRAVLSLRVRRDDVRASSQVNDRGTSQVNGQTVLRVRVTPQTNETRRRGGGGVGGDGDMREHVFTCTVDLARVESSSEGKSSQGDSGSCTYEEFACMLGVIPWPLVRLSLTVVSPSSTLTIDAFHIGGAAEVASGSEMMSTCTVFILSCLFVASFLFFSSTMF